MKEERGDFYYGNFIVTNNTGHELRLWDSHTGGRISEGQLKGHNLDTYWAEGAAPQSIPSGGQMTFESRTDYYIPGDTSNQYWTGAGYLDFGFDREKPHGQYNPDVSLHFTYGYDLWKYGGKDGKIGYSLRLGGTGNDEKACTISLELQPGTSWDPYRPQVQGTVTYDG